MKMIKLLLILQLLLNSDAFETYDDQQPKFTDWTEYTLIDNTSNMCQRRGQYIVCPQLVRQANPGAGRAYAITNGYIYDAPDMDACLTEWIMHQLWVPEPVHDLLIFYLEMYEYDLQLYELIMFSRLSEEVSYMFEFRAINGKPLYNGYMYTWYEADVCVVED